MSEVKQYGNHNIWYQQLQTAQSKDSNWWRENVEQFNKDIVLQYKYSQLLS